MRRFFKLAPKQNSRPANSFGIVPFWVAPAILVMAIGTVWLRLAIIRTTYSITQTERMIANLKQEREQVELKVAGLRSPRRLESLARAKFSLQQPKSDQVVYLK